MTSTLNAHEAGLKHTLLSSAALLCCDHRICNRGIAITSSVWNKTMKNFNLNIWWHFPAETSLNENPLTVFA